MILQMNTSAKSSHPVMHIRSSGLPQPSLLPTMLDFNGTTTNGRPMGAQIFCTDCHNSDDNREFGRNGPNGPHGSKWWHILERDYESSQAPGGPGTSDHGQFESAARSQREWPLWNVRQVPQPEHSDAERVSWSLMPPTCLRRLLLLDMPHRPRHWELRRANPTGVRMIDFDLNVVGSNGGLPITYDQTSNTCVLVCHNTAHDPGGGIRQLPAGRGLPGGVKH